VRIAGGDHDVTIEGIVLGLVTRVESEHGDNLIEFHRLPVSGPFQLRAGENRDLPFSFPMPWETPITDVYGQRLHGMTMGLRTELAVAKAVDKGDLDQVAVHPLPAQERILDAFARLGFRFKSADLEHGAIYGVRTTLPFYQEIEFYPPPQYAGAINEVEVTFIADPQGVEVVLEFDKRGGFLAAGHDSYGRFRVSHADVDSTDWAAVVEQWVSEAAGRYQGLRSAGGFGGAPAPGYGAPGYGGHGGPARVFPLRLAGQPERQLVEQIVEVVLEPGRAAVRFRVPVFVIGQPMPDLLDRQRMPGDQEGLDSNLAHRLRVRGGGEERLQRVLDPAAALNGADRVQFRVGQAHPERTARNLAEQNA
jgi:sporulation-control protein